VRLPGSAANPQRYLWMSLPNHEVSIEIMPADGPGNNTGEVSVVLKIASKKGGSVMLSLSALTPDELRVLRSVFNIAFDLGTPIATALYEEALEIEDAGGTPLDRIYREFPRVVVRPGTLGQYDQGVLQRRPNVLAGLPEYALPEGSIVQAGGRLAQHNKEGGATGDDSTPDGGA